mgnify:CR=1 FL=1
MIVEIDKNSGFCFGVVRAISKAEAAVKELGGEVYSLGDIVHNRMEVQRLEALGLKTVTHEDMESLAGRDLFIRAHGEPPTTYRRAEELGIRVIDATCPVVAQLQGKVVAAHEKMQAVGGQVVILGKRGHAEVVGLTGQVANHAIVVEREEAFPDTRRSSSSCRSVLIDGYLYIMSQLALEKKEKMLHSINKAYKYLKKYYQEYLDYLKEYYEHNLNLTLKRK